MALAHAENLSFAYPGSTAPALRDVSTGLTRMRELGSRAEFDVAVLAERGSSDPRAYEEAGATWWLESIHDQRGSAAEMLELVAAGPAPA